MADIRQLLLAGKLQEAAEEAKRQAVAETNRERLLAMDKRYTAWRVDRKPDPELDRLAGIVREPPPKPETVSVRMATPEQLAALAKHVPPDSAVTWDEAANKIKAWNRTQAAKRKGKA